jgi:hypothetical protein
MREAAFWFDQNIAGYTFPDHRNEGARRTRQAVLLSVKKPRRQRLFFAPVGRKKRVGPALEQGGARLLLALKMPAQERLSRSGGALTPTQTRHPANGLKCLFLHPPLISCKNRLPRRGTEGGEMTFTQDLPGTHKISQFLKRIHSFTQLWPSCFPFLHNRFTVPQPQLF